LADQRHELGDSGTEPEWLPSPPGVSRLDTLPEDFIAALSRRPLAPGDVLAGRYKLIESLGDGAMGQVFVAENLAIGRRVAVKLLKPELLIDRSFRLRFQQEATATAAVEHRNVARFFDLVAGDPTFLVVEYVPGETLQAVLKREGSLDPNRVVRIAIRLCWALEAAHGLGIIHRDVKPANVILSPDPELGEEPKLIDFGLAKLPTMVGAENLTRTGQIIGTPHYMSPEQIANNKDVDGRADVYALGCLVYHMLAGEPPFAGSDDVQVLYQQISETPPPLGPRLRGPAPEGLVEVVERSLQKKPAQRYSSMLEMSAALEAIARKSGGSEQTERFAKRAPRRPWLAIAAATLAVLASAMITHLYDARGAGGAALLVRSRPDRAQVRVDGRPQSGVTPLTARGLAAGSHQVRVELAGRAPLERTIELGPGELAAVDLVLPPSSHPLEVQSIPSGGSVFVDDAQLPGATPLTVTITDDDFHEVRVEKLGYEPATHAVKPDEHSSVLSLPLSPEREPRGRLIVESTDQGEVFLDGKDTYFQAPTIPIFVAVGEHTAELRDSATGRSAKTRVVVQKGDTVRVSLHYAGGQP
jgi:serine/threonine-protein kinase